MMQGMPGWTSGMQVAANTARPNEPVGMAFNSQNNTVLVSDQAANAVRIMDPSFTNTISTITLPQNAQAGGIAVNDAGTMAAVAMSGLNAIALIDPVENRISATVGVDAFPVRVAFAGNNLMVTNAGADTVSVIDLNSRMISQTVKVGHGPWGIAVDTAGNRALVANMQSGTVSMINLSTFASNETPLPSSARPYDIAISPTANQAVIPVPTMNSVILMNLADNSMKTVNVSGSNAFGPAAVAVNGNTAYVANMMSANVTSMDLNTGAILNTTTTDPGPRSLAVEPQGNSMLVLAQGTQTVDMMNLTSAGGMSMSSRMGATGGTLGPAYGMPAVTSVSPNSAKAGTTFSLTINGSNLSGVNNVDFEFTGSSGMGPGQGPLDDTDIKISSIQVNSSGTQLTAVIAISSSATPGTRRIHLDTPNGDVMMGGSAGVLFTVLAP
jgi:YVTN family beta-propeller protein